MTGSADIDLTSTNIPNDDKETHCVHQQSVSKLSRSELEDLFYQLYDENINIKKKLNSLDNKYKVMSTRMMRLSRDHKCVDSVSREEDQKQLRQLRQNEAALRAKVTVLRGQLASHTRLHSAALSKLQRPRSQRCSRGCRTGTCSSCGGDDRSEMPLDSCRSSSQNREVVDQSHNCSPNKTESQSGLKPNILPSASYSAQTNAALQEQIVHLQERAAVLEEDMKLAGERSRQRISELEGELASHLSHITAENVELIRARRINKQQEAIITSLQQEHQELHRQLEASKTALTHAARDQDQMCCALERERQRNVDFQQDMLKLTHMCASLRDVQEQLNDLKKENMLLKEHSNKLLQITDSHHAGVDAEQTKSIRSHAQDAPGSRTEHTATERKLNSLCQEQSLLQQQVDRAQSEVTKLQKNLLEANEERYSLQQELSKARKDCVELQKELVKPLEEREKLIKELADIRDNYTQLEGEVSKTKADLQEKQFLLSRSKQEQSNAMENTIDEKTPEVQSQASGNVSSYIPINHRRNSVVPQPYARTIFSSGFAQTQSQPVTPRPRIGDACLTLLEQTAIRPAGNTFPGVLGSHVSLQERFLELCLPASSPSASSTPLPPMEELTKTAVSGCAPLPESLQPKPAASAADSSSKQVPEHCSPRHIGLADTQWELEKCRELLRVQCNLNSMYKKEVASLNHIVKTLTSSVNDTHS